MKIFAIVALVVFFIVKAFAYTIGFLSKRGYVTDYERVATIVLPIMSLITYVGCFYYIGGVHIGFIVNIVIAWLILLGALTVMYCLPYAFCYVIADNNVDCYRVAKGVIRYTQMLDRDIVYDDNIGVDNSIRISFNKKKFSREKMAFLIKEQYIQKGAVKTFHKISLLGFLIHAVELIFDISFLVNISMI